jgi:hypothetical protein
MKRPMDDATDEFRAVADALRAALPGRPHRDLTDPVMRAVDAMDGARRVRGLAFGIGWLALRPAPPSAAPPSSAVERGIAWLIERQRPDGSWDAEALGGRTDYGIALNGLAALAIARRGEGTAARRALRASAAHLAAGQGGDGGLAPRSDALMYNHGIAALALLEASERLGEPSFDRAVERAVAFIVDRQAPHGGWGYRAGPGGEENTSITAWQLQVLLGALTTGRAETGPALRRGLAWLTGMMDGSGGFQYSVAHPDEGDPVTRSAMGAFCVLSADGVAAVRPEVLRRAQRALERMASQPPADFYESYFRAEAVRRSGTVDVGSLATMERALRAGQLREGVENGSWAAADRWGPVGGALYSTSMALLTLPPG